MKYWQGYLSDLSINSIGALIFVVKYLPETRGRSLEEIEADLRSRTSATNAQIEENKYAFVALVLERKSASISSKLRPLVSGRYLTTKINAPIPIIAKIKKTCSTDNTSGYYQSEVY